MYYIDETYTYNMAIKSTYSPAQLLFQGQFHQFLVRHTNTNPNHIAISRNFHLMNNVRSHPHGHSFPMYNVCGYTLKIHNFSLFAKFPRKPKVFSKINKIDFLLPICFLPNSFLLWLLPSPKSKINIIY